MLFTLGYVHSCLMLLHIIVQNPTFPHEGAFAVVHYLLRDKGVVDHVVVFHAAKAAVLHTLVDLILLQRTLHERADSLHGSI